MILCMFWGTLCLACQPNATQTGGIIALTPSLTEAVWAIGTPKHMPLIATSPYTTDKRAQGLMRLQAEGSLEQIAALQPTLVLLHPSDTQLAARLQAMQIPVIAHSMDTTEDIEATLNDLGHWMKRKPEAQRAIEKFRAEILPPQNAPDLPQMLLIIDRLDMRMQQFYIAQPPAFIADLVEGCGYTLMRPKADAWTRLDAETLMHLNPKRILFLARSDQDAAQVQTEFERMFKSSLQAVKTNQLFIYPDPDITIPGPEMGQRQQKLCHWLKAQENQRIQAI